MTQRIDAQEHYDQRFQDMNFDHARLGESEFEDCKFTQCSFESAALDRCRFINCTFEECNLSLAAVPGSAFSGTRFMKSKLIGIDWTQADWASAGFGRLPGFRDCVISHSSFIGLELKGVEFINCLAHEVDFREADLSQASFMGTDLDRSLFGGANLAEADLSRARNYQIDPASSVLKKARFSLPEAMALLHSMDIVLEDPTETD
ncbi:MAG: pentapeptide repeat-containing protein [Anaerolineales bacterium]|nr:pentapeptide repeat-containing protein [Anaerolineales bacterium]